MTFDIPSEEKIIDRIEEPNEFLQHFPESPLAPVFSAAISELEAKLERAW